MKSIIFTTIIIISLFGCSNNSTNHQTDQITTPTNPAVLAEKYNREGILNLKYKKYENALAIFLRSDTIYSNNPKTLSLIAQTYKYMGNCNEALPYLYKLQKIDQYNYKTYGVLADCHSKLGNTEKAINSFKTLIELNPNDYHGTFLLGVVYFKNNQFYLAKECFNSVSTITDTISTQLITEREKHKIRNIKEKSTVYLNMINKQQNESS